ncbi:coiled-coil domain containing 56 [Lycorma delicatula]|uniref:coiled-coil domain containing 56 n=1 Tax=Lycorma delicatula TaxID=130591 RepID=UPI003F514670
MADDQLKQFDPEKQKHLLSKSTLEFMKIVEAKNRERVERLRRIRQKNIYTGLGLGAVVFGIYGYSIYSVKQETFLDDFEPPVLVPKSDDK